MNEWDIVEVSIKTDRIATDEGAKKAETGYEGGDWDCHIASEKDVTFTCEGTDSLPEIEAHLPGEESDQKESKQGKQPKRNKCAWPKCTKKVNLANHQHCCEKHMLHGRAHETQRRINAIRKIEQDECDRQAKCKKKKFKRRMKALQAKKKLCNQRKRNRKNDGSSGSHC